MVSFGFMSWANEQVTLLYLEERGWAASVVNLLISPLLFMVEDLHITRLDTGGGTGWWLINSIGVERLMVIAYGRIPTVEEMLGFDQALGVPVTPERCQQWSERLAHYHSLRHAKKVAGTGKASGSV